MKMNLKMLYTIGVGNAKSYMYLWILHFVMYLISLDLRDPMTALVSVLVLSGIISGIGILIIAFYNSDAAVKDGTTKYITSVEDKNKIFKRIAIITYIFSIFILTMLYFFSLGIASYYPYTGPMTFLLLIIIVSIHETHLKTKYKQLENASWVFDYKKSPAVTAQTNGYTVALPMFNEENGFKFSETVEAIDKKDVFKMLPPGTQISRNSMRKPSIELIEFNENFKYLNIHQNKTIFLKRETELDIKIMNTYIDILKNYTKLYDFDKNTSDCCKTTININGEYIDNYVANCDYIGNFVTAKKANIASINLIMKPDLGKLSIDRFLKRVATVIEEYELKKVNNKTILTVLDNGEIKDEVDISYLKQYMSMNLDEYMPVLKEAVEEVEEHFVSLKAKLDSQLHKKLKEDKLMREEEEKLSKTLYRIGLASDNVYLFKEDFKNLSEIDEIIITHFINRDINQGLKAFK